MRRARALEPTHNFLSTPNSLGGLDSLLDPSLVEQDLEQACVATLCKRRLTARLLSNPVKGKVCQILTSMADPLRFPSDEIVDLYCWATTCCVIKWWK